MLPLTGKKKIHSKHIHDILKGKQGRSIVLKIKFIQPIEV